MISGTTLAMIHAISRGAGSGDSQQSFAKRNGLTAAEVEHAVLLHRPTEQASNGPIRRDDAHHAEPHGV